MGRIRRSVEHADFKSQRLMRQLSGRAFGTSVRRRPILKTSATDRCLVCSSVRCSNGRDSWGSPLASKRRRRRSRRSVTKSRTSSFSCGAKLSASLRSRLSIAFIAYPAFSGIAAQGDRLRATWNSSPPSLARRTGGLLLPGCWSA